MLFPLVSHFNILQSFNYTPDLFYKKKQFKSEIKSFCIWIMDHEHEYYVFFQNQSITSDMFVPGRRHGSIGDMTRAAMHDFCQISVRCSVYLLVQKDAQINRNS